MKSNKQVMRGGLGCGGLIVLILIVAAVAGCGHQSGTPTTITSTTRTSVASTAVSRRRMAPASTRAKSPCAHITRSAHTSCRFAGAVKRAYLAHPDGTESVYSPVTRQMYSMRCVQAKGVVACSGGESDSAQVAFVGPSGPGTTAPTPPANPGTGSSGNTGAAGSSGNTGEGGNSGSTGQNDNDANTACQPLTDSGNCYEPGEYCRDDDHGASGTAGDGEAITCEDNDGWRWEPN